MESPPQYPGAPKKSKTGLIIGLSALAIVLCCCGVCGLGAYFGKGAFSKAIGLAECSTAMAQQRDGILAFADKHGGKLPGKVSWQDDIKPYVTPLADQGKSGEMIHIPTPDEDVCDRTAGTSITFNATLAGQSLDGIKDPYGTVLLFETPGKGRNKNAAWKEPDFKESPVLLQNERRGWIRQPVKGQAFYKDKRGMNRPAPAAGANVTFGDTPSKAPKDNSED